MNHIKSININKKIFLISLATIKQIGTQKIYLQIIPLLLGYYSLIKEKHILRIFWPILGLLALNLIPIFKSQHTFLSLTRILQFIGLLLFAQFLIVEEKVSIQLIVRNIEILSIIKFIYEIIFTAPVSNHPFLGFYRYKGIIGEPNFSAFLFLGLFLINFSEKKYTWSVINFIFIILCQSLGTIMTIFTLVPLLILYNLKKYKQIKILSTVLILILLTYPLEILISHQITTTQQKILISKLTSYRYPVHYGYIINALKKPFGNGYFIARKKAKEIQATTPFYKYNVPQNLENAEQHNLFINILSDFGWVGYTIFVITLLYNSIFLLSPYALLCTIFILSNGLTINLFNELIIYILIAYNYRQNLMNNSPVSTNPK